VTRRSRAVDWLLSCVLLAYPRAFRRRFGAEMRADFHRSLEARTRSLRATSRTLRTLGALGTLFVSGLAERWAAFVRWSLWPDCQPHLYEPSGRHLMFWDTVRTDIRFAVRQATRAPSFAGLAVLAFAIGIAVTSAVFSVVNGVLLRPLPYGDPDRLAMIWSDNRPEGRPLNVVSAANFMDYRGRNRTFEAMDYALSFLVRLAVQGEEDAPPVWALRTGAEVFRVLRRDAALGRTYGPGERGVAVVSHAYWDRRLGRDPAVIGRALTLSGNEVVTIVGVMPPDFAFPYRSMFGPWVSGGAITADMWIPMPLEGNRYVTAGGQLVRNVHSLVAIGRLRPGVSVGQAGDDLAAVARQLEAEHPESNRGWGTTVVSLTQQIVGGVRPALLVLFAGVGVILLMAAVNVANLVLARGVARQREFAVRTALGAPRRRLIGQSLIESLILALAGAGLGLLLVSWGVGALVAMAPVDIPRIQEVSPDWRVLAVTLVVAAVTGLLVGLVPAISAGHHDVRATLQDQTRGTIGSRTRQTLRSALVVAEVALAVLLTIGAGLLLRSFVKLMDVDPGFRSESLLTLQMNVPDRLVSEPNRPVSADQRRAFYEELLDRLTAIPGVVAVGGTTRIPLGSSSVTTSLQVDGRDNTGQLPEVEFRRVMRDFFQAMGTPVVRGRLFGPEDGPTAEGVAVVNETLARRIFGETDPIGQHVGTGPAPAGPWIRIIGVVGDVRHTSLEADPLPEIYLNYASNPPNSPYLAIRTAGDPAVMAEAVRREARSLDSSASLYDIRTMEAVRAESVAERRFLLTMLSIFGAMALLLAGVGVYGVMLLVVAERTPEVGVRLALGAAPREVLGLIVLQAAGLSGVGVALGLLMSAALAPLLASQLFGVGALDPVTFVAVPAVLMLTAMLAAIVPARRAMRVDPLNALRYE
jgi:putative ABC transport system permease protein